MRIFKYKELDLTEVAVEVIAFYLKSKLELRPDLHADLCTNKNLSEVRVCKEVELAGGLSAEDKS